MRFFQHKHNIEDSTSGSNRHQQTAAYGTVGSGRQNPDQFCLDNNSNIAVQSVIGGIQDGALPLQFTGVINVLDQQLGNRGFMQLVGELLTRRQHTDVHEIAANGLQGSGQPLTHLETLQKAFGHHDISRMREHTGPEIEAMLDKLGAEGYSNSGRMALTGPVDLFTQAHEAAHGVQQAALGDSLSFPGVGSVAERYERQADAVAEAVVSGQSAQPLLDEMVGGPVTVVAASTATSGVLQFMPKKKEKTKEESPNETSETPSEAVAAVVPESEETLPRSKPGKKKKKNKSKVQVALNILRAEGVDGFQQYINDEITLTDSLHTIRDRILRAEGLGGIRNETMKVVEERLKRLDRQRQCEEEVAIVEVKEELSYWKKKIARCCRSGTVEQFRVLLRFSMIDVNMALDTVGPALCHAAKEGRVDLVKELLSMPGIGVNCAGETRSTPLLLAVVNGRIEVIKLLLAVSEIEVNSKGLLGYTPLHTAIYKGDKEIVKLLLAAPNINIEACTDDGKTPLILAIVKEFPRIVKLLVKRGVNINSKFDNSEPILSIAIQRGNIEIIKILLGVPTIQIDLAAPNGATALHRAVRRGNREIVELLLKNSADPNLTYRECINSLHLACLHGHTDIVKMLLNAGADIDAEIGAEKYTPHSIAQLLGHQGIMVLLEARQREKLGQAAHLKGLSLEDKPDRTSLPFAPTIPPSFSATVQATQLNEATNTSSIEVESELQSALIPTDSETHMDLPLTPVGRQPSVTETQSSLALAKNELIQDILKKLRSDNIGPLAGIRMITAGRQANSIEEVCEIHNRLAGIERQEERAKRRRGQNEVSSAGVEVILQHTASTFVLGKKLNLNADSVEGEIKQYLEQSEHRFVSQVVTDMELGRGKAVSRYPEMLHASAGISGVGSCTVFYYTNAQTREIKIVGIGHHLDRETYRLTYTAEELNDCGSILRLS